MEQLTLASVSPIKSTSEFKSNQLNYTFQQNSQLVDKGILVHPKRNKMTKTSKQRNELIRLWCEMTKYVHQTKHLILPSPQWSI